MRKEKKQHKKNSWKENMYNTPYLIAIIITSLGVMLYSEEIGIRAIAREMRTFIGETRVFVSEAQDRMSGRQEQEVISSELTYNIGEDEATGQDVIDMSSDNAVGEIEKAVEENAGTCRNEIDGNSCKNDLTEVLDGSEDALKTEEAPIGVTNFEFYDPVEIDSYYYSDAGKVALTTEYPYGKEDISYFNDAAFLGDSRTLGISDYAGLDETDFYCDSGMTIFKLLTEEVTYQKTGNKVDLTQVLQEKQYGKIYIMLGMNELGYGNTEMYLNQYSQVLQQIREWQPGAIIYIMANLHVSREKNNPETEFNNININSKNAAAASLANGTDIFYLDANPLFTDHDGFLDSELTFDGVHLYAKHYDVWREFLLEHAVEPRDVQRSENADATDITDMTSATEPSV